MNTKKQGSWVKPAPAGTKQEGRESRIESQRPATRGPRPAVTLARSFLGFWIFLFILAVFSFYSGRLLASDPPHRDSTDAGWCLKCHTPHSQLGTGYGVLTRVEGNANLCISCHNTGGRAESKPFIKSDQAVLGSTTKTGWSHRWDSGAAGYVDDYNLSGSTTGRVLSGIEGGTAFPFIGTTPRIYEIRVSTTGNAGTSPIGKFNWLVSQDEGLTWVTGGTGINMTTSGIAIATPGPVANGDIKVAFIDGSSSPSFAATRDIFRVYVRPEITYPQNSVLRSRMFRDPNAPDDSYRKVVCSTCHNQHSQARTTSDPTSNPSYTTAAGISNDRHFQRINNISDATCRDCHRVRNITSIRTYTGNNLSHPIGINISSDNTPMHVVPYEAVGAATVQTQYSYRGYATSGSGTTVTTLYDSTKSFDAGVITKIIRFTTGASKNTTRTITGRTATSVSWAGATTITVSDKYEIDADGNLSNNLRLYNLAAGGVPSFTAGQVICLSCHNMHWADSSDTTADVP